MPHCEAALTDALLAANRTAGTLHNVVILGNRFSGYQASWALPCRTQQQQRLQQVAGQHPGVRGQGAHAAGRCCGGGSGSGCSSGNGDGHNGGGGGRDERPATMLQLCDCGAVQELCVSERGFSVASAFNDLGLHWFPPDWQARLLQPPAGVSSG